MKYNKEVSGAVIRRLPSYYRCLSGLRQCNIIRISSNDLGKILGVTPSQVRQDLSSFGAFGVQGYGYDVDHLHSEIHNILGLDSQYNMIIIGAGHLGRALANYVYFEKSGFRIVGIFETNDQIVGSKIKNIEIMRFDCIDEFVKDNQVDIAVISVPSNHANEVASKVINLGVSGLWNFAPVELKFPKNVITENVQLSDSLMVLGYKLKENRNKKESLEF